jgi:hypothetical protein
LDAQLEYAKREDASASTALTGDAEARRAFHTLLPIPVQRGLFLEFARRVEAWPRLSPLFGAPPYDFLLPGDASELMAGGFSAGRVNMTHETRRPAMSYSHFGAGHLVDTSGRIYNVSSSHDHPPDENTPLPFDLAHHPPDRNVVLQVRLRKDQRGRSSIHANVHSEEDGRSFPTLGKGLLLQHTPQLKKLLRELHFHKEMPQVHVRVRRLVRHTQTSRTAAVVVSIV